MICIMYWMLECSFGMSRRFTGQKKKLNENMNRRICKLSDNTVSYEGTINIHTDIIAMVQYLFAKPKQNLNVF